MRRLWLIVLAALAVVVLGVVYYARTGHAPTGQPPLVELNSAVLSSLQDDFNRSSDQLRIILLLSPT